MCEKERTIPTRELKERVIINFDLYIYFVQNRKKNKIKDSADENFDLPFIYIYFFKSFKINIGKRNLYFFF